jgi:Caspase domain
MRRVALLVGNSKFAENSGIESLRFPRADVEAMASILSNPEIGRFDRVESLIERSRHDIVTSLNTILDEERGAVFLFYYSGHGKISDSGRLFLAASDTSERLLPSTGVPFADILQMKEDLGCGRFCAVLDCCYAGLGSANIRGSADERLKAFAEGKGIFFLGAANATAVAREDMDLSHGLLTAAIVDGLKSGLADVDNDGRVTGPDLFSWCRDFATKRGSHKPIQVNRVEDDDLVIAFSPRRLAAATIEAVREKLRVLWENQLLPADDLDALRQYFLERISIQVPPPNSLPGNFLAFVERKIEWDEFWNRRTSTPTARVSEHAAHPATPVSREPSLSIAPAPVRDEDRVLGETLPEREDSRLRKVFRITEWNAVAWVSIAYVLIWVFYAPIIDALSWLWSFANSIGFKAFVPGPETIPYLVLYGEWTISLLLLFVIAWVRFNSPPTNRSGTTFALFFFGLIFYAALIVALWLVVIIAVRQGSINFDKAAIWLGGADPRAQEEFKPYAPLVAALVIVVVTHFSWVRRMDNTARAFCITLAAIPQRADGLARDLVQFGEFQPPTERLRSQVAKIISESISAEAVSFNRDGTLPARFTRAVALYWLFIGPNKIGVSLEILAKANERSAYVRIMQLFGATAARADTRYEELVELGLVYFNTSAHATKEVQDALSRTIMEVSNLACSLIARYVLYSNITASARRRQLSKMGFYLTNPI